MKKTNFVFISFIILNSHFSFATECIGSKDSQIAAIYLHGMDSEAPSTQELQNRNRLTNIAKSLNLGFAIPRATERCPDGKLLCWGWNFNDHKSIEAAINSAQNAKAFCFPKAKHVGLIGFSNGGFVANQILKDCRKTDFDWLISIGAGGSWIKSDTKDLSKCASLTLVAGKKDQYNYEKIKEFGNWLQSKNAKVNVVEYDDGHTLPEKELENILKSSIQ